MKQNPKYLVSPLTNTYYKCTKYKDLGNGRFVVEQKVEITKEEYDANMEP